MAPAQIPVLLSQKPSTENGQVRVVTLRLAWLLYRDQGYFGVLPGVVYILPGVLYFHTMKTEEAYITTGSLL